MTSVAGIVEYIARTEGPDTSPPSAPTSRTAGWTRPSPASAPGPLSLGESQPALEAIAIPVAQFKDPVADVGPSSSSPTQGQGQAHPQLGAGLPPAQPPPLPPAAPRPAAHRRDAAAPGYLRLPASADGPAPSRPGAVLTAIQGFGAQQEAERRALAARQAREAEERRQALWPSACRPPSPSAPSWTPASAPARSPGRRLGALAGVRGGVGGAGEGPRLQLPARARAQGLRVGRGAEASRAEIDAAEEQAAREEAEDNARFRHLHH
eukprot:tig00021742_g23342.t1